MRRLKELQMCLGLKKRHCISYMRDMEQGTKLCGRMLDRVDPYWRRKNPQMAFHMYDEYVPTVTLEIFFKTNKRIQSLDFIKNTKKYSIDLNP